jgi:ATP-binding cassette subfamily B protein
MRRASASADADEILVLDKGRVVERGRHEDLLARNGAYAAMWNRQRESEEEEREEERRLAASEAREFEAEAELASDSADNGFT